MSKFKKSCKNQLHSTKRKKKVTVSATSIQTVRKKCLGLAKPKINKLILTNHHKKMRKKYADIHCRKGRHSYFHQVHADEAGFGFGVKPNPRNNHVYCEKGKESSFNIHNISNYDLKNV